eukprot:197384-Chlamydomonas_euryale.AAC.2
MAARPLSMGVWTTGAARALSMKRAAVARRRPCAAAVAAVAVATAAAAAGAAAGVAAAAAVGTSAPTPCGRPLRLPAPRLTRAGTPAARVAPLLPRPRRLRALVAAAALAAAACPTARCPSRPTNRPYRLHHRPHRRPHRPRRRASAELPAGRATTASC